jgi:hypothetical protein
MMKRSIAAACLSTALFAPSAWAEPRNTVWLEDVHLLPAGGTALAMTYEYQGADAGALEQGIDLLALRLEAGLSDAVELTPVVRFRQRGDEAFRLQQLGGQLRWRLLSERDLGHLVVYGGYLNNMSEERDHLFTAGAAGEFELERVFLSADARSTGALGGSLDDTAELWMGAGVGVALLPARRLTVGLETFAIVPLGGARMSDPALSLAGESNSYYYGPNLSLRAGPLWTAFSAASGYGVSDAASDLLIRWMVGVSR